MEKKSWYFQFYKIENKNIFKYLKEKFMLLCFLQHLNLLKEAIFNENIIFSSWKKDGTIFAISHNVHCVTVVCVCIHYFAIVMLKYAIKLFIEHIIRCWTGSLALSLTSFMYLLLDSELHSVNYHDMARGNLLCASTATASCIIVYCVLGCEVDLKLNTQFCSWPFSSPLLSWAVEEVEERGS